MDSSLQIVTLCLVALICSLFEQIYRSCMATIQRYGKGCFYTFRHSLSKSDCSYAWASGYSWPVPTWGLFMAAVISTKSPCIWEALLRWRVCPAISPVKSSQLVLELTCMSHNHLYCEVWILGHIAASWVGRQQSAARDSPALQLQGSPIGPPWKVFVLVPHSRAEGRSLLVLESTGLSLSLSYLLYNELECS